MRSSREIENENKGKGKATPATSPAGSPSSGRRESISQDFPSLTDNGPEGSIPHNDESDTIYIDIDSYWHERDTQTRKEALTFCNTFELTPTYQSQLTSKSELNEKNAIHELDFQDLEEIEIDGQKVLITRFGHIRARFPNIRRKTFSDRLTDAQKAAAKLAPSAIEFTKRGITSVDDAPNAFTVSDILPFTAYVSEMVSRGLLSGFGFISYSLEAGGALYQLYKNTKQFLKGKLTTGRFIEEMLSQSFRLVVSLGALTVASLVVASMVGLLAFGNLNIFIPICYALIAGRELYASVRELQLARQKEETHKETYKKAKKEYRDALDALDEGIQTAFKKAKALESRKSELYAKLEKAEPSEKASIAIEITALSRQQIAQDEFIAELQKDLAAKKAAMQKAGKHKKERLAAERDVAIHSAQLAIGLLILTIVVLGTVAVTSAGIASTMGIAAPGFIILGIAAVGFGLKVFQEVDRMKDGALSRGLRKSLVNLGAKIKNKLRSFFGFSNKSMTPETSPEISRNTSTQPSRESSTAGIIHVVNNPNSPTREAVEISTKESSASELAASLLPQATGETYTSSKMLTFSPPSSPDVARRTSEPVVVSTTPPSPRRSPTASEL